MSPFKMLMGAFSCTLLFGAANAVQAASITGHVQDSLGRPITAVTLSLKTVTSRIIANTKSDVNGRFNFTGIKQGTYAVQATKPGFQLGTSIVTLSNDKAVLTTVTLAAQKALEIQITAKRFNRARNGLSPKTGGSLYRFDEKSIQNLPQGANTSFNQVLLQAPGVVNDSFGQLHIRGDHGNIQYRINGVILPESISGFGQALSSRFAKRIDLVTGALPAQYGFHTAGVIEIKTKTDLKPGGHFSVYGGSNQTFNPSFDYGNTTGKLSYFVNGSYLTNNVGIEKPTPGSNPLHDTTKQSKGFGYFSYLLNPTTKINLMLGSYQGTFQIPTNPGKKPDPNNLGILAQMGLTGYNSARLQSKQGEVSRFAVSSLQGSLSDKFDYQLSLFTRYSSFHFTPDIIGNLVFNGVAPSISRSSTNSGIQADASYRINKAHTLRMGMFGSNEDIVSNNTSSVFPLNPVSGQVSGPAFSITDNNPKKGNTQLGLYLQDEWRATNKLTLNYGARFDTVNAYVHEHQFSPRFGIVYKATDQTTWHAGYARYFTPPPTELISTASVALFQNTTNGARGSTRNSQVKSERSDYLDAGVSHQLTQTIKLGFDSYYKKSKNVIDEGQFGPALFMTPFNYAQGKIYGVELTSNYKSGNLSAYLNIARNVSKAKNIVSGQHLFDQATLNYAASHWVNVDHQQNLTISAGSSYLWSGTHLNGNLIFQSGLRNGFANTTQLPGYTVVNLGAHRTINMMNMGKIELRLAITNALDKVYKIRDGSGIGVQAPQYGRRRGVFIGLSKAL
ncbi:MAG: TonB-dependent receptor [Mariprofundaceae bacterium]|nr:TonB-dependent receptor [Mariprofundaceae bacterium]